MLLKPAQQGTTVLSKNRLADFFIDALFQALYYRKQDFCSLLQTKFSKYSLIIK
jgi:hypothetical protein